MRIASSMKKFTGHTVVGVAALKKHLAEIRQRGFSINFVSGTKTSAAWIGNWDRNRNVVAAIGITVPIHRLAKETIDPLGRLVMKAAAQISHELGYVGFKKQFLK